jgi:hypothetical protein
MDSDGWGTLFGEVCEFVDHSSYADRISMIGSVKHDRISESTIFLRRLPRQSPVISTHFNGYRCECFRYTSAMSVIAVDARVKRPTSAMRKHRRFLCVHSAWPNSPMTSRKQKLAEDGGDGGQALDDAVHGHQHDGAHHRRWVGLPRTAATNCEALEPI